MRTLLLCVALFAGLVAFKDEVQNIYSFKVKSLDGDTINFKNYKGKKIMIVNTASKCGYTPQYEELQKLYEEFDNTLVIVGFPANNFGGQEPGSNDEINKFCKFRYGVTFPMAEKISVKGDDMAPIYQYLIAEAKKLNIEDPVKWNFTKFLLDENGKLLTVFSSKVKPNSEEVLKYLK